MRVLGLCGLFLGALALTMAMQHRGAPSSTGPCNDGTRTCAAAEAPAGMRSVYKGQRMIQPHWFETTTRESGVSDIGVKAQWRPILELR